MNWYVVLIGIDMVVYCVVCVYVMNEIVGDLLSLFCWVNVEGSFVLVR